MTIYNCECNADSPYENRLPSTISDYEWETVKFGIDETGSRPIFVIHKDCLNLPANKNRYDVIKESGELLVVKWKEHIR